MHRIDTAGSGSAATAAAAEAQASENTPAFTKAFRRGGGAAPTAKGSQPRTSAGTKAVSFLGDEDTLTRILTAVTQFLGVRWQATHFNGEPIVAYDLLPLLEALTGNSPQEHLDEVHGFPEFAFKGSWPARMEQKIKNTLQRLLQTPAAQNGIEVLDGASAALDATFYDERSGLNLDDDEQVSGDDDAGVDTALSSVLASLQAQMMAQAQALSQLQSQVSAAAPRSASPPRKEAPADTGSLFHIITQLEGAGADTNDIEAIFELPQDQQKSAAETLLAGFNAGHQKSEYQLLKAARQQGVPDDDLASVLEQSPRSRKQSLVGMVSGRDYSQGCPSAAARSAAEEKMEIKNPSNLSGPVKRGLQAFLNEAPEAGLSKEQKKKRVEDITQALNQSSHAELLGATGQHGWMANLGQSNSAGECPNHSRTPSFAQPIRGKAADAFLTPLDFARKEPATAQELLDDLLGESTELVLSAGKITAKSQKSKFKCDNITDYLLANDSFLDYAQNTGYVRNLQCPADYVAYRAYVRSLVEYEQVYSFVHVLKFDLIFRRKLYDGELASWNSPAEILFKRYITLPTDRDAQTKPKPTKPIKAQQTNKKKSVAPVIVEKDSQGVFVCSNYNAGRQCAKNAMVNGTCKYAHICSLCGDKNCKNISCSKNPAAKP